MVEFDTLYPMFIPSRGRKFELSYGSSGDVDLFVASLPVKEMHQLHVDICKGNDESVHNYLWMVRWLDMCMELSEMCDDNKVDCETLQKHVDEGRHHECRYNRYQDLLIAMDIVDMLAEHIQYESTWKPCSCTKCNFYRSSEWMKSQPRPEPCASYLPAAQFYMGEYFTDRRFY
ncbi:Hypothetical protein PHPALM_11583 [Phytophthora palmivora]|uniref:Uncharacterized protein n=1 Tax=Phytophthora palmivora TaxID=4796 RepID=A0A2P4Y1X4_9STRA|nr:Hypothetical protein PHPALM_11583 [Phytophthora palmivora]